jgi:hypothetical protein
MADPIPGGEESTAIHFKDVTLDDDDLELFEGENLCRISFCPFLSFVIATGRGSLCDNNVKFYFRFLEHHKFRLFMHILFVNPIDEEQDCPFTDIEEDVAGKRVVLVPVKRGKQSAGNVCWYALPCTMLEIATLRPSSLVVASV